MPHNTVFADVQWWDWTTVTVKCPFCSKLHTHGLGSSYEATQRAPHCGFRKKTSSLEYTFRYPFSKSCDTTTYEIDKVNKRYVALEAKSPSEAAATTLEEDLSNLSVQDSPSNVEHSWEEATEEITLDLTDPTLRNLHRAFGGDTTFSMKRFDHVMHRMLCYGDKKCVQAFLDSSSDSGIFLRGCDPAGKTTLILAACEKYPDIVKLLLEYGANPNRLDFNERTPLMEAALWGRSDNVKHLLAYGAQKDLRDKEGSKAIDFAEVSDKNDEERFRRSGAESEVYRENTFLANRDRKLIKCLLKDHKVDQVRPLVDTFPHHFFLKTTPHHIKLLGPLADYPLSTKWKTIARLERGGKYPHVSAMSGWAHDDNTIVVSGRDWTNDVMRVSYIVSHILGPVPGKDQGQPGRHNASHAEKQLIAYFISKHLFLTDETRAGGKKSDLLPQYESLQALRDAITESEREESAGPLHELANRQPPIMTRRGIILVSKEPCVDCMKFQAAVNSTLSLDIRLQVVPTIELMNP